MVKNKNYKVIVIGLPKTGTSTLAIMLRILGYQVTGPENNFIKGDLNYLKNRFENYNGFQDYPWCFEWEKFFDNEKVKFIILVRNKESWWKSFLNSYGRDYNNYQSYSYINLIKSEENKIKFLSYYDEYYKKAFELNNKKPNKFLVVDIKSFQWRELCLFLNEKVPKNIFGKELEKPHINKNKNLKKDSVRFKLTVKIRKAFLPLVGEKNWNKTMVFLRKNNLYK